MLLVPWVIPPAMSTLAWLWLFDPSYSALNWILEGIGIEGIPWTGEAGWARFSVITTGSIALLGFVFGDYMTQVLPLGPHSAALWGAASIVVLTWLNVRGVRQGAATQVLASASELSRNAERLRHELATFLGSIRAA